MNSRRPVALLSLLLALVAGLLVCSVRFGNPGTGVDPTDVNADVLAADGGALASALEPAGDLSADDTTISQRQAIVIEVLPTAEELAASEAAPSYATRLHGLVVRGDTPVPDAKIVARKAQPWFSAPPDAELVQNMFMPGRRHEAVTDSEGRFELFDVPPGKLALTIRAAGLAPLERGSLEVPEHTDYDLGRFQMELGISLEGNVYGPDGEGLAGVTVLSAVSKASGSARLELPGLGIPLAETDLEGGFVVEGLAPGSWQLIFDSPSYRVQELQGNTEQEGQRERGLRIQLEAGLAISGKVLGLELQPGEALRVIARRAEEQPSGAADDVKGAERFRARHADVLSDGSFAVTGLAPGVQYKLRLYQRSTPKVNEESDAEPLSWQVKGGVDDCLEMAGAGQVEFKYRAEAVVVMLVKNAETGAALANFQVHISGSKLGGSGILKNEKDEPQQTFPGGQVRYEGLMPPEAGSSLTVRVRATGFADYEQKGLMLRPGQELVLDDLQLEAAPMGPVRVLDKLSGEPISGARVLYCKALDSKEIERYLSAGAEAPGPEAKVREAATDAQGLAHLTLWKDNVCVLKAVAEGYQAADQKRHVPPFTEVVELQLTHGGQITVHVSDDQGQPVAGMFVEHAIDGVTQSNNRYWDPEAGSEDKTDETGDVIFANLPMGKHEFSVLEKRNVWGRGGESAGFEAKGDVYLAEGEFKELDLRVQARGGLNLVLLEGSQPLAGALVKIKPVDEKAAGNNWWFGPGQQDPRTQISDFAGRVSFAGIKVGTYLLRISHAQRRMVIAREVLLTSPPGELRLEVGLASIEGRLTDQAGEPISGVSITIGRMENQSYDKGMDDYSLRVTEDEDGDTQWNTESVKSWAVQSDNEGHFVLRGVAPGELLKVYVSNLYVIAGSRQLGPLGDQEYVSPFDFTLERAGALRVELQGIDRRQLGMYRLLLARMEGDKEKESRVQRLRSWRTNLTVQSMRAGRWRLRLLRKGIEATLLERFVEITAHKTEQVTLRL